MKRPPRPRLAGPIPMIEASDLPRSIAFYTEVLGFDLNNSWPEDAPSWACLTHGDQSEVMLTAPEPGSTATPVFTGSFYFKTDDVLALHERVAAQVAIEYGPEVFHYGMHEFAVRDPDGYLLQFGQPTEAEPTCPPDE